MVPNRRSLNSISRGCHTPISTAAGPGGLADFRGFRRGAWTTGAWDADNKYMWGIQRMTNVNLSRDPHPLAITDPDLFKYP